MSETYNEHGANCERAGAGYQNWPHWPRADPDEHDERREKHRCVQQEEAPEARFTAEGREEILLKAAPYPGQRTVHPHADDALTVEAQPTSPPRAPQTTKARVHETLTAHPH